MTSIHLPPWKRAFSILLMLLLCISPAVLWAQETAVAVLPFENSSGDPQSDYLGKIAEAILMYDLAGSPEIELVSRSELEAVLQEKQLALSGLLSDAGELQEIGGLSGADFLVRGEYVHLGDDILFLVKVISVDSAEVTVHRARGTDENTIHHLAEKVAAELTGKASSFTTDSGERSIISMKNESPGSIALFSPLIDAEIFLDGNFVGYTTGDPSEAFVIQEVRPGPHVVRVHLTKNFGVIELPEIEFKDWSEEVQVRPSGRTVLRDQSRHFNSILYELHWILREDQTFSSPDELTAFRTDIPFSFLDRNGQKREGSLELSTGRQDELLIGLKVDGQEAGLSLPIPQESGSLEDELSLDIVKLEAEIEYRYGRWELDYSLSRTDVYQGLHREEYIGQ